MDSAADVAKDFSGESLLSAQEEEKSSCRLIADGLIDGFKSRAQSNAGLLCAEVGTAAATGVALQWMTQAGGRWGCAAKIIGGTMALGMGADIARRGSNIYETYTETANDSDGQAARQKAIADNAGTALFDYPVIALAGMGAARLASGPRAALHTQTHTGPYSSITGPGNSLASAKWDQFNPRQSSQSPVIVEWSPGQKATLSHGSKTRWTDESTVSSGLTEWRPGSRLCKEIDAAHQISWNLKTEIVGPDGKLAWVEKTNTRSFHEPIAFANHMHKFRDRLEPILRETPTDAGSNTLRITEQISTGNGARKTTVLYDRPVPLSQAVESYKSINELIDPYAYRFVQGVVETTRPNIHPGEVIRPPMELTTEQLMFQRMWEMRGAWRAGEHIQASKNTAGSGSQSDAVVRWEEFNAKPSILEWSPRQHAVKEPSIGSKKTWTDGYSEAFGSVEWRPGSKLQKEIDAARHISWNLKSEIVGNNGEVVLVAKTNTQTFNEPLEFADRVHKLRSQLDPILRETPTGRGNYSLRVSEEINTGVGGHHTSILFDRPVSIPHALESYRSINEIFDPHAYRFVPHATENWKLPTHHGEVVRPPLQLTDEQVTFGRMWRMKNFWEHGII